MNIAFILYPGFEELDFVGPWEVFGAASRSVAKEWKPYTVAAAPKVTAAHRLTVEADYTFETAPRPELVIIPGGDAIRALEVPGLLPFVEEAAQTARYMASVCTGAFILEKAGLLKGRRATTHWGAKEYLRKLQDVTVVDERWVHDGNIITAAGVSAGIDGALYLVGLLTTPAAARSIQEYMEYYPSPPYQDVEA